MNKLSWLIYLSGSFDMLQAILQSILVVMTLLTLVSIIAASFSFADGREEEDAFYKIWMKYIPKMLTSFGVMFLLLLVVPSGETVRLIAASEVGQQVLESKRVQGIVDPAVAYIEQWLKDHTLPKKQ